MSKKSATQEAVCVLVVEDEDQIRLSLRDYLRAKGYAVLVASDGLGALKLLLDHDVDVVVSDYKMDVLGGDYWVRFLQKYCSDLKVIVTSGFLRPGFPVPFPVVFKPFEYADLELLIAKHVSRAA